MSWNPPSLISRPIGQLFLPSNMQRPTYGQSPPLHHPVPQHVSTVPQLRSPPPPPGSQPQSQNYGNPYQAQPGAAPNGNVFGQYGNFMNEPTAQFAAQFGQSAFKHGQEYLEQNVSWSCEITISHRGAGGEKSKGAQELGRTRRVWGKETVFCQCVCAVRRRLKS